MRKIIAIGGALAVIAATFALVPPGAQAYQSDNATAIAIAHHWGQYVKGNARRRGDAASNITVRCFVSGSSRDTCFGQYTYSTHGSRNEWHRQALHFREDVRISVNTAARTYSAASPRTLRTWVG